MEAFTGAQHLGLVITHKSDALRLARLFGKLAYHSKVEWRLLEVQQKQGPFNGR